jgi:uncharacterized protein (TIGR03435 family)
MKRSSLLVSLVVVSLLGIAAAQPPTFEAASVKPNKSGPRALQRAMLQPGERVTLVNVTPRLMIQMAYPEATDIIGAPTWIGRPGPSEDADRFDVNAKADVPSSREQLQAMMRSLLADRFKLTAHTEPRETPIFALVLARRDGKLGPKLHPATTDCQTLRQRTKIRPGVDPCGRLGEVGLGVMMARGLTLDALGMLKFDVDRLVENKTGLSGIFDWDLTWTPQVFLQRSFDRDRFPAIDPDGPSIFTALQEQLGLKLEAQKGSTSVLVIDHIEHPTAD